MKLHLEKGGRLLCKIKLVRMKSVVNDIRKFFLSVEKDLDDIDYEEEYIEFEEDGDMIILENYGGKTALKDALVYDPVNDLYSKYYTVVELPGAIFCTAARVYEIITEPDKLEGIENMVITI